MGPVVPWPDHRETGGENLTSTPNPCNSGRMKWTPHICPLTSLREWWHGHAHTGHAYP